MHKKTKLKFKAVIFDMDGVITNTMPFHFDAWLKVFSAVGIKVNCYDIYCREGQGGLSTVREIYKEHGRRFNLKEARQILSRKEDLFKAIARVRFVKGARPFIRELKRRKFKLGLVTGTSRKEIERILPRRLLRIFDVTITGNETKKGKPDPAPFLKAIRLLKVSSSEAAVIENAPFGIEAAKRANLFCIALKTSLPKSYLLKADMVFESFRDLKQRIHFEKNSEKDRKNRRQKETPNLI